MECVSILLWAADGSEILDYRGRLDDGFEWGKYIGVANSQVFGDIPDLPQEQLSIHHSPRLYRKSLPEYTYRDLRRLLGTMRQVFAEKGRGVRLGCTFDPSPEFAVSPFKYRRHQEVCLADTLGDGKKVRNFVCCYAELHADPTAYAGFPKGIEEGTSFGKFLGRQARRFCEDMGFDYIWLSNGFGFGLEAWGVCGALFDGRKFDNAACVDIKKKILRFWVDLRRELPGLPIETRGTNLSTAMDLASDGVPLREIYRNVPGVKPPPNSPWAALNGDFGMELAGWMSHIAELPKGTGYPFRFYVHDPWFINSPWLDRYGRNPHDIYLPLAVARLGEDGRAEGPDRVCFLSVDDSCGNMPEQVPNEVIPHIRAALDTAPDKGGPVIWLYPFDEYHEMVFSGEGMAEVFFGDWFMRTAINCGFPVGTVVSTGNLEAAMASGACDGNVLVAPTAAFQRPKILGLLSKFIQGGGKVLLYGPVNAPELLALLGLERSDPISGELTSAIEGKSAMLRHEPTYCAGGIDTVKAGDDVEVVASVQDKVIALRRGNVAWVRGGNSFTIGKNGRYVDMLDRGRYFYPESLMRILLGKLGYLCEFDRLSPVQPEPMMVMNYCRNALYLSSYVPDMNTAERLRFPEGAPIFVETETLIRDGLAVYHFPKAVHMECRVFVEMQDGAVRCKEFCRCTPEVKRRLEVSGLKDATLRFRPEPGFEARTKVLKDPGAPPYVEGDFLETESEGGFAGNVLTCRNVTGTILISW
ncbi:MAG: hypothetical protein IJJ33_03135 [Victivallales bacterium]|nr:hypothetical protein [Victivallales bacterium]